MGSQHILSPDGTCNPPSVFWLCLWSLASVLVIPEKPLEGGAQGQILVRPSEHTLALLRASSAPGSVWMSVLLTLLHTRRTRGQRCPASLPGQEVISMTLTFDYWNKRKRFIIQPLILCFISDVCLC